MLGTTGKRILLVLHLTLNSIWTGGIVAVLFLNLAKSTPASADQLSTVNEAIFRIHDIVVMYIGFGVILTGFLFSLFTKWGFFEFSWVIVKWAGLVGLFVVLTFFLAPVVTQMAALSDLNGLQALEDAAYRQSEGQTTLYCLVLLGMIVTLIVVSVFKPWGPRKKPFATSRKWVLIMGLSCAGLALGGSAFQFVQLERLRSMPIRDVGLGGVADGTYAGVADLDIPYRVELTVRDHRIAAVHVLKNHTTLYATLAQGVTRRIVAQQTVHVRAITGATTTSKCLMKAAENALASSAP